MSFLDAFKSKRLREGLAKTRDSILSKVQKILAGRSRIDDDLLEHLEEILIAGDLGVAPTMKVIDNLKARAKKDDYQGSSDINRMLREELQTLLANSSSEGGEPYTVLGGRRPHVIMVIGVNGVGKTTTIGKLAYNYRMAGKKVLIAAADTFRAAANEQLEIWSERAGVEIIRQIQGADPAAVAFDALQAARSRSVDIMIIDTAGRLHTKVNLMEELKKISRVLQKQDPEAPHEVLLVLDASTGQNAIQQARQFAAAVRVTGIVVTKLDGTAKGGVVLSISSELNLPVKYVGVGEGLEDLQPFERRAFVDALFEE